MQSIVDLIIGTSTTLDVYVVVRLVVVFMGLELFTVACGLLGNMKGR